MADVPYASHFNVEEHIVVLKETETKCRFSCSTSIIFNKGTVMKNTILTRTFADLKEDYIVKILLSRSGVKISKKFWRK